MKDWLVPAIALPAAAALAAGFFAARAWTARMIGRRLAVFQAEIIQKHTEEVQNIYREMRGWRHDFHNHIQTMKAYRSLGQDEKLDAYLWNLDADLGRVDRLIKSGNVMVDAILNSKLSLAESRDIRINARAAVPAELSVTEIDLCVILGNLLDNAMEACAKVKEDGEKFIRVYIDVKREMLYLSVTNSSGGSARRQGGRYLSTKTGNHGFGLMRVGRIVEKYQGYIKCRNEEGVFTAEIMLPA